MIVIGNVLIDDEISTERFACNLAACKGACCVEGDGGAPLTSEETQILEEIRDKVLPFLTKKGVQTLEEQGIWIRAEDGSLETPLVNGKECAYTVFENGVAACGIEKAYRAGKIGFQKPISCHLYPIRIDEPENGNTFEFLRYDRWDICSAACKSGKKQNIRIYEFCKDALIRKYGTDFYRELEALAGYHELSE